MWHSIDPSSPSRQLSISSLWRSVRPRGLQAPATLGIVSALVPPSWPLPALAGLGLRSAAAFARQNCAGFTSERQPRQWDFFSSLTERPSRGELAGRNEQYNAPLLLYPRRPIAGVVAAAALPPCRWTWMHRMSRGVSSCGPLRFGRPVPCPAQTSNF